MRHAQKSKVMILHFVEFVFVLHTCFLFNIVLKVCVLVNYMLKFQFMFVCNRFSHFLCTILQNMCTYLKKSKLVNVSYKTLLKDS